MVEVLTIIFAFIIFMVILGQGYLAAIRPMSLIILIGIALVVGYVLAMIVSWLFSSFITIIFTILIIGAIALLLFK